MPPGTATSATVVDLADLVEARCVTPLTGSMGALEQRLAMLAALETPTESSGRPTPNLSVIPGGAATAEEPEAEPADDLLSTILRGVRGV